MKSDDDRIKLIELLQPYVRPAVALKVIADESAIGASVKSKFGGAPYAEANDKWPVCPVCKNELTFITQLQDRENDALQVFYYCLECLPWGLDDEEEGEWAVRSYLNPSMQKYVAVPAPEKNSEIVPCSVIEHDVQALPDWESLDSLVPGADELCDKINSEDPWDAHTEAVEALGCIADIFTMVGGYPHYVQGQVQAKCGKCKQEMEFFAQIDSEDQANLMWGDMGSVYLFRCKEHQDQFHLELQCY